MTVVTHIEIIPPHALRVEFSDGTKRTVDLTQQLHGEVFEPLKDPSYFAKAVVDTELGTVVWPNGADFSPEFLYRGAGALASA